MPEALKLTKQTIVLSAIKTDQPIADVRALFEHRQSRGETAYIVFDYTTLDGKYVPWFDMIDEHFHEHFKFVYGEELKRFSPIHSI